MILALAELDLTLLYFQPTRVSRVSGGGNGLPNIHLHRRLAGLHQDESVQEQFHGGGLQHIGLSGEDES